MNNGHSHICQAGQAGLADFGGIGPAGGAVGGNQPGLARAPDRHADGDYGGHRTAGHSDDAAGVEHLRCIGLFSKSSFCFIKLFKDFK